MEYAGGDAAMSLWDDDLAAILADGGPTNPLHSTVQYHGVTTYGVFNEVLVEGTDSTGEPRAHSLRTLVIQTGSIEPSEDENVIVDGITFRVRHIAGQGDGRETMLTLARVSA
jgi:hypothetical protein